MDQLLTRLANFTAHREGLLAIGEGDLFPQEEVDRCKAEYEEARAKHFVRASPDSTYLKNAWEAACSAALEHGHAPESDEGCMAAKARWEAASGGNPGEGSSQAAVKHAAKLLENVKQLYKGEEANGRTYIEAAEQRLEAAKVLNGKTPADDLKASEQARDTRRKKLQACKDKTRAANGACEAANAHRDECEENEHEAEAGLAAAEQKVLDKTDAVAAGRAGLQISCEAAEHMRTALSTLSDLFVSRKRGQWADGGNVAFDATEKQFSELVQTLPEGFMRVTAMPVEVEATPGPTAADVSADATMDVDTVAGAAIDAAAVARAKVSKAREALAQAEAVAEAAGAHVEATTVAATALVQQQQTPTDGFTPVAMGGGKPTAKARSQTATTER